MVAKKLNLIQLPELTARSPKNARFQLGFRTAHALIAHRLVARPNSPKWKPAFRSYPTYVKTLLKVANWLFALFPNVSMQLYLFSYIIYLNQGMTHLDVLEEPPQRLLDSGACKIFQGTSAALRGESFVTSLFTFGFISIHFQVEKETR